jgi:hypothetical protein
VQFVIPGLTRNPVFFPGFLLEFIPMEIGAGMTFPVTINVDDEGEGAYDSEEYSRHRCRNDGLKNGCIRLEFGEAVRVF